MWYRREGPAAVMASSDQDSGVSFATGRIVRWMDTPEGVPLRIEIADPGERAAAFGIDLFILSAAVVIPGILLALFASASSSLVGAGAFAAFVVRIGYFIFFEVRWHGSTPGKRIFGLCVIRRSGGPLTLGSLLLRNLMREAEVLFPLSCFVANRAWDSVFENLVFLIWAVLGAVFALLNADRRRPGDLVANTIVIAVPKMELLGDLARSRRAAAFTRDQLKFYGELELTTLEELLRRPRTPENDRLLEDIGERIRRKIGLPDQIPPDQVDVFLRDFYAAQRAELERRRQFGKPRASKRDGGNG
jgi:uncharacterized RDD family membrane protein YckC